MTSKKQILIIINVVSVVAGFWALIFSHIVPIQNFSLLVALSMLGAGVGALTLLLGILIFANRAKEQLYRSLENGLKSDIKEKEKKIKNKY